MATPNAKTIKWLAENPELLSKALISPPRDFLKNPTLTQGDDDDGGHRQTSASLYSDPNDQSRPWYYGPPGPANPGNPTLYAAAQQQSAYIALAQQAAAAQQAALGAGGLSIYSNTAVAPSPGYAYQSNYHSLYGTVLQQGMLHPGAVIPVPGPAGRAPNPSVWQTYDTKPLEHDGIELGEVIAWRAWRVVNGWLTSFTVDHDWPPGEVVHGEVGAAIGQGIHAFKHRVQAIEYAKDGDATPIVIGRVKLWGEIIEFDKGWHAEHAYVASLDVLLDGYIENAPPGYLAKLREVYGLEPVDEIDEPAVQPAPAVHNQGFWLAVRIRFFVGMVLSCASIGLVNLLMAL